MKFIMKITSLVFKLIKFRLKGFKFIDFWIDYNLPPNDYCDFIINNSNFNKYITLKNWIN